MSDSSSELTPTPEQPIHPVHIDLPAYAQQQITEYNNKRAAQQKSELSPADLADSPQVLKSVVETVVKKLIRKDREIDKHLEALTDERRDMIQGPILELTQNTLVSSFNPDTQQWHDCSLSVNSTEGDIVVELKQTTPVPQEVIQQLISTDISTNFVDAGITRTSTPDQVVGGAGTNLIKASIESADAKLTVEQNAGETTFKITIPKQLTAGPAA